MWRAGFVSMRRGAAQNIFARAPMSIVYVEGGHERDSACRRERAIKRLSPEGKRRLIAGQGEGLTDA